MGCKVKCNLRLIAVFFNQNLSAMQTKAEEVMMVSSKYKQLYECRLPAQAVRFHQDPASEPEPQDYSGPDIPQLLSPMHNAQCLVKVSCS